MTNPSACCTIFTPISHGSTPGSTHLNNPNRLLRCGGGNRCQRHSPHFSTPAPLPMTVHSPPLNIRSTIVVEIQYGVSIYPSKTCQHTVLLLCSCSTPQHGPPFNALPNHSSTAEDRCSNSPLAGLPPSCAAYFEGSAQVSSTALVSNARRIRRDHHMDRPSRCPGNSTSSLRNYLPQTDAPGG